MNDLYHLLGVEETADSVALKKAWRSKARELHPDRHGGSAEMASLFAAVNAAYDVLSDPERRKNYDRYGEDAASVFFDPSLVDKPKPVEPAVPVTRFRAPRPVERGEDLRALLRLSPAQVRTGGVHTLTVEEARDCPTCEGTGWRRAGRACSKCEGGRIPGLGPYRVQIPPGVLSGQVLLAPGLGRPGRGKNAPFGDLLITLEVPPVFTQEREVTALELPVPASLLREGGVLSVPLPDGETARVRVRPGSSGEQRIRLPGKGRFNDDLLVRTLPLPDDPIEVGAVAVDSRAR